MSVELNDNGICETSKVACGETQHLGTSPDKVDKVPEEAAEPLGDSGSVTVYITYNGHEIEITTRRDENHWVTHIFKNRKESFERNHKNPMYVLEKGRDEDIIKWFRQKLECNKSEADIIFTRIHEKMAEKQGLINDMSAAQNKKAGSGVEDGPTIDENDEHVRTDGVGRKMYFDCYIPIDYEISQKGMWVLNKTKKDNYWMNICSIRIMVTGRFKSTDGEQIIELTYIDKSDFKKCLVPMFAIMRTQAFREHLTPKSIRITETNLCEFFEFANACIDANENEGGSAFRTGYAFNTNG